MCTGVRIFSVLDLLIRHSSQLLSLIFIFNSLTHFHPFTLRFLLTFSHYYRLCIFFYSSGLLLEATSFFSPTYGAYIYLHPHPLRSPSSPSDQTPFYTYSQSISPSIHPSSRPSPSVSFFLCMTSTDCPLPRSGFHISPSRFSHSTNPQMKLVNAPFV